MNWWLYALVVNPLAFGIYGIIRFFKITERADKFLARKKDYYQNVLDYTEQYSKEQQCYNEIKPILGSITKDINYVFSKDIQEIKAGLSFARTIVTLGIWGFV